jgi:crotonobetaine/carnitine-CoA ligase
VLDRQLIPPHAVARWAMATPDAIALQHVDGPRVTYRELDEQSRHWAAALRGAGIAAGQHVATILPNTFAAHRTLLGLAWLRAVEVPINTEYRGAMLEHALRQSEATALITTADVLARVPNPPATVVLVEDIDALLATVEPATDLPGPEPWDIACLLFTSGTTGPSKAVRCPWGLVYQMWSWVPPDVVQPGDGIYNPLPLFHNSGRSGFATALARGARFIIREKFSATNLWDDVRVTNARAVALVGPMTSVLFSAPPSERDRTHPVESIILGPMIPDQDAFEARFGVRVATCYGQTEIGAPLVTGWEHGPWANCGSLRTDWPFTECRLVDEHDDPVAAGTVGELIVRTAEPWALNAGYQGMADATADAWRNGWFHTGDAFRADADGRYYFVDRMKDAIRRRGENISSFEVENAVLEHDDVIECAAIGVAAEHGDQEVMVALIVRDPAKFDPAALVAFLVPRLPKFMVPRYVEVFDDLPRNETTRRVRKAELRARGLTPATWDREALV